MPRLRILSCLAFASSILAAEPLTLPLFPEGAPGERTPVTPASEKLMASYGKPSPTHITEVKDPTITVYRPEKPNGTCVIVAPGGGFMFLTYASEGTQVCEWLNTIGVTGVLLKYRVPTRDEKEPYAMPVADARRALSLVRSHAVEWGVDPKRVGLLGFSAGGNLLGHAMFDAGERPDFGVMIYGGGFLQPPELTQFKPGFAVPADSPPMFFAVAHDDKNNPIEAARLYLEYKKLGLSAELHVFTKGGHGFGMRKMGNPINEWPQRCADWMGSMGFLK